MPTEVTGRWEDLVSRPEFRGHQVRITVIAQPAATAGTDDWLESLRRMASNSGGSLAPRMTAARSIYEGTE